MSLKILVLEYPKNRRPFRKKEPVEYEKYIELIERYISHINLENKENLLLKFRFYVNNFDIIKKKRGAFYASDFGFYPNIRNEKYYIDRGWSISKSKQKVSNIQSMTSLQHFSKKYGEEIGIKKFQTYISKKSDSFSSNYKKGLHKKFFRPSEIGYWKHKGFNKEEAKKEMISKFRPPSLKFHEKLRREGKKWITCRQLKFWISKGLSYPEASEQIRQICDTRSLKSLIEKYGVELGKNKFQQINTKWQNTLKSKSPDEILRINLSKFKNNKRFSEKSIKFFDLLMKELNRLGIDYGKHLYANNEYFIYDSINKKINFYDLYLENLNLLVEYNGILFHPNKEKLTNEEWKNWRSFYTNESAESKHANDLYKMELARSRDFFIIEIWEDETIINSTTKIVNYIKKNILND